MLVVVPRVQTPPKMSSRIWWHSTIFMKRSYELPVILTNKWVEMWERGRTPRPRAGNATKISGSYKIIAEWFSCTNIECKGHKQALLRAARLSLNINQKTACTKIKSSCSGSPARTPKAQNPIISVLTDLWRRARPHTEVQWLMQVYPVVIAKVHVYYWVIVAVLWQSMYMPQRPLKCKLSRGNGHHCDVHS